MLRKMFFKSAQCRYASMKGDCVAIAAAIARNCEFRYEIASFRVSKPRSPGFFSKCPPFPWRMPGFGRAPTRLNGMWGMTRPARTTDTGDGPGSASGAGVAGATPAAVCGPQRGMACEMHRCRKHRCTGSGMGRHPNYARKMQDAHIARKI